MRKLLGTSNLSAHSPGTALAVVLCLAPVGCSDAMDQAAAAPVCTVDASTVDASTVDVSTADASSADVSQAGDAGLDASAALSLLAAGATQFSVMAAVPGFAIQNGLTINYTFGSAGSLRNEILTGTSGADIAIVTPAVITALEAPDAQSFVYPGSRIDLAQIGGGVAVRSSDPLPDISTSDTFKAALLAADEIYYPDPALATAGAQFVTICTTLGIQDTCAVAPTGKGHTAPDGATAMSAMANSTATTVIGCTQISEIKSNPLVVLVGDYPSTPINLQVETVYSAIIVEGTAHLANAQLLLQFLGGDVFQSALYAYGFGPISEQ